MEKNENQDENISMKEIMDTLKSMKSGNAVGFDRIFVEMLRARHSVVASQLHRLFNHLSDLRPSVRRPVQGCHRTQRKSAAARLQKLPQN